MMMSSRRPDAVTSSSNVLDSTYAFNDDHWNNVNDDIAVDGETDDEEDDPIVRTIDVYLSPALSHTLHLLQFPIEAAYPSHHRHRDAYGKNYHSRNGAKGGEGGSTNNTPAAARYRPKHNMLELDYTIPSTLSSSNSMGGISSGDKRHLQTRIHASNSIEHVTHSALAKLDPTGTRLDVVPLRKSVFQMRPTFHHLHGNEEDDEEEDGEDNTNEEEMNMNEYDVVDDDENNNMDDHRRPIMFAKKEIDPLSSSAANNSSSSRRNSYAHKRAEEASEEWMELQVHVSSSGGGGFGRGSSPSSSLVHEELMDQVSCDNEDNELRLLPLAAHNGGHAVGNRDGENINDDGGAYVKSLNYLDTYSAGRASGEAYVEDLSDWTSSSTLVGSVHDDGDEDKEDAYSREESSSLTLGMDAEGKMVEEHATAELASKLAILLQHGNGTMIPYCVLRSRFRRNVVPDSMLLAALSSCAVLVRGNFALKSSLAKFLHASSTSTTKTIRTIAAGSGVGGSEGQKLRAKAMSDLRDLILLLLNMHGAIQRERLIYVYSNHSLIHPDTITFVLNTVAKKTPREESCWVAKVDDDEEFAATFPEVAACHAMYWMKRKEMLKAYVRLYENAK